MFSPSHVSSYISNGIPVEQHRKIAYDGFIAGIPKELRNTIAPFPKPAKNVEGGRPPHLNTPLDFNISVNGGERIYKNMVAMSHELQETNGTYTYIMRGVVRSGKLHIMDPQRVLIAIEESMNHLLQVNPNITDIKINTGAGIGTSVNGRAYKGDFIHRISITFKLADTASKSYRKIKKIDIGGKYLTLTGGDIQADLTDKQIYTYFNIQGGDCHDSCESCSYVGNGNQQAYTFVFCLYTYDKSNDIVPGKSPVILEQQLKNKMPGGLKYYEITNNTRMTGACIEFGKNTKANYITIQSDPDLFPIQDWNTFVRLYENKYRQKPLIAFAGGRTGVDGMPEGLNITNGSNVHQNLGNPGSGFIIMGTDNIFKIVKKSQIGNGYGVSGFQERYPFGPGVANTFNKISPVNRPWRWIIGLRDGTWMLWQSGQNDENMYTTIDNDSGHVALHLSDGRLVDIVQVLSVESVGCGDIYIDGIGGASQNSFLRKDGFGGTLPESNVIVITQK